MTSTVTTLSPARLERLRSLVNVLETAWRIPGTRIRFGADAIIGLVPGLGDVVGGLLSSLVVVEAIRGHVPRPVVQRMLWNVAVDLIVGAVPVAGDVFDVFWKAGVRNLALLEKYQGQPALVTATARRHMIWMFAVLAFLAAGALAVGLLVALVVLRWLTGG